MKNTRFKIAIVLAGALTGLAASAMANNSPLPPTKVPVVKPVVGFVCYAEVKLGNPRGVQAWGLTLDGARKAATTQCEQDQGAAHCSIKSCYSCKAEPKSEVCKLNQPK